MYRLLVACLWVSGCGFEVPASDQPGTVLDARRVDGALAIDGADPVIDAAPDAPPDAPPDTPPVPVTANFPITIDTYVDSLNSNTMFGATVELLVDGPTQTSVILWRTDLSSIPTTAAVQVAELHLWTGTNFGSAASMYEMLEPWTESGATWNQRSTGVAWSGTGASPPSRGTVAMATVTPIATGTEHTIAFSTALVGKWVATPATNLGAAVATTSANGTTFRSGEDGTVARRPYLRITYLP